MSFYEERFFKIKYVDTSIFISQNQDQTNYFTRKKEMLPFANYEIEKWHRCEVEGRLTCGGGIIGKIIIIGHCLCHSFETWLNPAGRLGRG